MKEKAEQLFIKMFNAQKDGIGRIISAKNCAIISIENEYHSLREQLFNLRSCGLIENENTYLFRLDELHKQEAELIKLINDL